MYKWMNVHIYKCLNRKYTHGQLYNVQMYNVQKYNVRKDKCIHLQMFKSKIYTWSTVYCTNVKCTNA